MERSDLIACIIVGAIMLLMIVMSIVLLRGKGAWMIAGFNTMDKEEQEQYDSAALCRFMGKYLLSVCLPMIVIPVGGILEIGWLSFLYIPYVLISAAGVIVYVNTGNRFKKIP